MLDNAHFFTVTDLKQYTYCPHVIFYERCLPHVRPRTYKMDAGRDAHDAEQKLAVRRTLLGYDILRGERFFNVPVSIECMQLTGQIDEVVRTEAGELFPVDYKLAQQVGPHYQLQLAAYALLLAELENVPVQRGYIYLIQKRKLLPITMTPALYQNVETALTAIRALVERKLMPEPAAKRTFFTAYEFRRFCNDV